MRVGGPRLLVFGPRMAAGQGSWDRLGFPPCVSAVLFPTARYVAGFKLKTSQASQMGHANRLKRSGLMNDPRADARDMVVSFRGAAQLPR